MRERRRGRRRRRRRRREREVLEGIEIERDREKGPKEKFLREGKERKFEVNMRERERRRWVK
jgi:hypothetical protein